MRNLKNYVLTPFLLCIVSIPALAQEQEAERREQLLEVVKSGDGRLGDLIFGDNALSVNITIGADQNTYLHLVCENRETFNSHCELILRLLRSAGADLEARNRSGQTPLLSLADRISLEGLQRMGVSADLHARDYSGNNLLHFAARGAYSLDKIAYLVDVGVDLNATNNAGETPLHKAAEACLLTNISHLLDRGADVTLPRTDDGQTAIQLIENCYF